jgi:hypothetical protein
MLSDIWLRRKLPKPPANFDEEFWGWLWNVGKQLDLTLFDDTPMPAAEIEELKHALGDPPAELEYFYSKCTPWGAMRAGGEIWNRHLQLIYQHTRQTLLSRGDFSSGYIESVKVTGQ